MICPQNQPGLRGFTGSVLFFPAHCSHHTTFQFRAIPRLFRSSERFRSLVTQAFDFNFFEFLTLGFFTTIIIMQFPSSGIWAAESARSRVIHGKRPISSSVLQSPYSASTPFCFEIHSLLMSPRTIQMPSHSSF